MFLFFFRKNRIKFYETVYVYMKQNNHGNAIKQCIIHHDNNTIKERLRYLTEVTLKSLKENREIRQKPGGEKYHYQQPLESQMHLTVTTICIQSVLENLCMQKL